jgi:hypothetical protein
MTPLIRAHGAWPLPPTPHLDRDPGLERQLCKIIDQQVGVHLPFAGEV